LLKYLAFLIGLFAIIVVLPATGEVFAQQAPGQNQSPPPTSAPDQARVSPTLDKVSAEVQALGQPIKQGSEAVAPRPAALDKYIAIALFIVLGICLLGALLIWQWRRDQSQAKEEKDLEALRISYGFWLVVGALLITFLVLVVTLTALAPQTVQTTDIVAIIGAVTGVIGTLTAAFFGIQAAGAGRSQAMTALSGALKTQETLATAPSKFKPSYGPHSGGTLTSITGNGFTGANGANFGVTPAASFEFVNDGLLRVNSPRAPDGVDEAKITLVFPGSSPPNREVGTFYYYTVDPCHGGEQSVTISGSGLKEVKAVKFGKKEVPAAHDGTRKLKVQTPSREEAGNVDEVDVTLIFPVDSPTNFFVVGKYRYDSA
jgi:uncharacterized Tic20 family protein